MFLLSPFFWVQDSIWNCVEPSFFLCVITSPVPKYIKAVNRIKLGMRAFFWIQPVHAAVSWALWCQSWILLICFAQPFLLRIRIVFWMAWINKLPKLDPLVRIDNHVGRLPHLLRSIHSRFDLRQGCRLPISIFLRFWKRCYQYTDHVSGVYDKEKTVIKFCKRQLLAADPPQSFSI